MPVPVINLKSKAFDATEDVWWPNQQSVCVFIDNDWVKSDYILVENKEASESEITIQFENEHWTGTLEELAKRIGLKH